MKPMLAATIDFDIAKLRYPLLVSPKLDGIRALIMGGVVVSRNFKPIPNQYVQKILGRKELNGLDGELIVGDPTAPDAYRKTMSGVMSEAGEPAVVYHVFDDYQHHGPFTERFAQIGRGGHPSHVEVVPHTLIEDHLKLRAYEEVALGMGYEGVMLRSLDGPYKHGRSTLREGYLMKLKRFMDSEATIVGCSPKYHNANELTRDALGRAKRSSHQENMIELDTLGSLYVIDNSSRIDFEIGTGFDDAQRSHLWKIREQLVGQIVKYKYFPTGSKERPRFPVFIGFRAGEDM